MNCIIVSPNGAAETIKSAILETNLLKVVRMVSSLKEAKDLTASDELIDVILLEVAEVDAEVLKFLKDTAAEYPNKILLSAKNEIAEYAFEYNTGFIPLPVTNRALIKAI